MGNVSLITRCAIIKSLFNDLLCTNSRLEKEKLVTDFKKQLINEPDILSDLDFCFEVLAGKHKLGYTLYNSTVNVGSYDGEILEYSIEEFYNTCLKSTLLTADEIFERMYGIPVDIREFMINLCNRQYKLGYSNKHNMITNLSPMLAKRYPETFETQTKYYVQEKLDGNRCIAYYDFLRDMWCFQSRSGKPLSLDFDMSWASEDLVFDGEVMTLAHAGSRDFNKTSGAINSKYGDKSGLHYFIYDVIDEDLPYEDRLSIMRGFSTCDIGKDCTILGVLGDVELYPNPDYNCQLDQYLDDITSKGGEGVILRKATGKYEHKRSNNLIKYKKTQTMDLRIIDWNEGQGKYTGLIGSFVCTDDDHKYHVNVAGISDTIRMSDPNTWIGKIIEVAYFDISKSKDNNVYSLRFPRMKKVRDDKNETSIY